MFVSYNLRGQHNRKLLLVAAGSKPQPRTPPPAATSSDLTRVNEPPDTVQHLAVVATATYTHSTSGGSASCKACVVLSRSSFSASTRGFGTPDMRVVSEHMRLAAAQVCVYASCEVFRLFFLFTVERPKPGRSLQTGLINSTIVRMDTRSPPRTALPEHGLYQV